MMCNGLRYAGTILTNFIVVIGSCCCYLYFSPNSSLYKRPNWTNNTLYKLSLSLSHHRLHEKHNTDSRLNRPQVIAKLAIERCINACLVYATICVWCIVHFEISLFQTDNSQETFSCKNWLKIQNGGWSCMC